MASGSGCGLAPAAASWRGDGARDGSISPPEPRGSARGLGHGIAEIAAAQRLDGRPLARPESSPPKDSTARLRKSRDFGHVVRGGRRLVGELVVVHVGEVEDEPRVGFAASRAVGGAVARNRAKRLLKEAWLAVGNGEGSGSWARPRWMVVSARRGIRGAKMLAVATDLEGLLERARELA